MNKILISFICPGLGSPSGTTFFFPVKGGEANGKRKSIKGPNYAKKKIRKKQVFLVQLIVLFGPFE